MVSKRKKRAIGIRRALRRLANYILHGGFVYRDEGRFSDGPSEYHVISGNRKYYVVKRIIDRVARPFRINRKHPKVTGFTKF